MGERWGGQQGRSPGPPRQTEGDSGQSLRGQAPSQLVGWLRGPRCCLQSLLSDPWARICESVRRVSLHIPAPSPPASSGLGVLGLSGRTPSQVGCVRLGTLSSLSGPSPQLGSGGSWQWQDLLKAELLFPTQATGFIIISVSLGKLSTGAGGGGTGGCLSKSQPSGLTFPICKMGS